MSQTKTEYHSVRENWKENLTPLSGFEFSKHFKECTTELQNQVNPINSTYQLNTPFQTKPVKIPKIIFQTWKNNDVPNNWKGSPISIKEHMPDWTYKLVTDSEMDAVVKTNFPFFC